MLRKRQLTIKVEKKAPTEKKDPNEIILEDNHFERKVQTVVRAFESTGAKMFLGVCIYVWLDTRRQVEIAKATNRQF